MRFAEIINEYNWDDIKLRIANKTSRDVELALSKNSRLSVEDFMALISPAALPYLEQMAVLSRKYTQQRFGKTIQFYIPLYLTNSCSNHCIYCGFNHNNDIKRIILTDEQIMREVEAIKEIGDFQHILLVTGENPRDAGVEYIENAINLVKPYFSSISVEVQPLKEEEYRRLNGAGLNAVYCYQETYNKDRYKVYHPKGMKSKFDWRLDTFDRMGKAGVHKIGLGVLIGLEDWRTDVTMMALHLRYLQKNYWQTKYSISFPRMRPHEGEDFQPNVIMQDKELAQLVFAYRIFDHDIEIALSTREDKQFRDNMTTLGVTSLSAGSKTDPGGYAVYKQELEQFVVNDDRAPEDILQAVKGQGYEVVWKDWDLSLQ
ncbi:2-iminoacetate synthase ThiH [Dysgonomonas sp. 216]|uniref:2-iminoacetate synthase ThiH n=1 Tax=Dysgonomonas sp. 216 TaxID=2302934 RepID=UPI0013D77121|nr:2-iminoacetate synthase ThiH [Dysgonomonas sp. 216]NDW19192.1 2-iminoacetate synthase ThiH [Dysgonomonas sp. 216]